MDTFFVPAPIKIEDDDDLDLDLECVIITPEKMVADWDIEIRKKIFKHMMHENDKFLDDLMLEYLKSLKEKIVMLEDKILLRDKLLTHIKFFYFCYVEMHFNESSNYLENMENILTVYCNLEMEIVRHMKKRNYNKLEIKQKIRETCRRISYVLSTYLINQETNILHVLIKMDSVPNIQTCKSIVNVLYTHFLIEFPTQDLSDEAFCRSYILFQKWKQICKPEEHAVMDKTMYFRYKQTPESIEKNKVLQCILTPSNRDTIDFVSQLFDSSTWSADAYFNYIKTKRTIENEPDCVNLDIGDDADCGSLDEDDFSKTLNEVVESFSSKISQSPKSNGDCRISDSDDDLVIVLDDADSDCVEILSDSDSDTPVFVIDDQIDDGIEEIVFVETKGKDHRKRNRNKRKKISPTDPVSLTSFLDSIPDILPVKNCDTATITQEPCNENAELKVVTNIDNEKTSCVPKTDKTDSAEVKTSVKSVSEKEYLVTQAKVTEVPIPTEEIVTEPEVSKMDIVKETNNEAVRTATLAEVTKMEVGEATSSESVRRVTPAKVTRTEIVKGTNSESECTVAPLENVQTDTSPQVTKMEKVKATDSDSVGAATPVEKTQIFNTSPEVTKMELIEAANSESVRKVVPTEVTKMEVVDAMNSESVGKTTLVEKVTDVKEVPCLEPPKVNVEQSVQCSDNCEESQKTNISEKTDVSEKSDCVHSDTCEDDSKRTCENKYVCSKCTDKDCGVNTDKISHLRTVEIQTEIVDDFKNCNYFYGIVTPPSEHHSTESQTIEDSYICNEENELHNAGFEDSDKTPQQSPHEEASTFTGNFDNEIQTISDPQPYITDVCSLSSEGSKDIVVTDKISSNAESVMYEENLVGCNEETVMSKPPDESIRENIECSKELGTNVTEETVEDNLCFTELETVQIPVEHAQDIIHLHSTKTDIVEAALHMAENELEINNSFDIEEHEIIVQDSNELIFDSDGICQKVYYLIDGQLVPCSNLTESNITIETTNEITNADINEVTIEKEMPLQEPVTLPVANIEPPQIETNDQINEIELPPQSESPKKTNENRIVFTSTDTLKSVSAKNFDESNDLGNFDEVLTSPITRINGMTSNHDFFNAGSPDLSNNKTKSPENSRSNSPFENSPAYDKINDFKNYYEQKFNLFPNKMKNNKPVNEDRKLKGILNKKREFENRINGNAYHYPKSNKRKNNEDNWQSKRVKFNQLVSLYKYSPPIRSIDDILSECEDPKLSKLKPTISLPKYTEEELLMIMNPKPQKQQTKQTQIVTDYLRRRTKSQIIERVVFDKSDENDIKVYKMAAPDVYSSSINMNSHRTVPPIPFNRTNPGICNPWESRILSKSSEGHKPPVKTARRGRPRKNSSTETASARKPTKRKWPSDNSSHSVTSSTSSFSLNAVFNSNSYFNQPVRPNFSKS